MAPHELLRLGRDQGKKFILLAGAKNDVSTSLTKSRQPIKCSSENSCQGYIGRCPKRKKKIKSWRSRTASPRHKPNTTAKSFPGDLEGSGQCTEAQHLHWQRLLPSMLEKFFFTPKERKEQEHQFSLYPHFSSYEPQSCLSKFMSPVHREPTLGFALG